MKIKRLVVIIALLSVPCYSFSQGCSDAGFCTMGAMQPSQDFNENAPVKLRSVSLGFYEGQSVLSPVIRAAILDLGFSVFDDYQLQLKLPYMAVDGSLGNTSGLGDISMSLTRSVKASPEYEILATLGAKIPTNRSNIRQEEHDVVLPMYYQTSLGTFDLVAGASYISNSWMFSAGYQQPIIHINENSFESTVDNFGWYEGGIGYVSKYAEGRHLKRGADIMMRVERNFRMSRLTINVALLPIYRITPDRALNENGEYKALKGTTGLALSGLAGISYRLNVFNAIKLIYGHQLADRKFNPDGLTRKHVISLNYTYNF